MNKHDLKEKFILLRAQGYSFNRLTKELGKSKQTLINWSKEFEEEIANIKNAELEALNERYFLSKRRKIKIFGERLKQIQAELDTRVLAEIPTDKLFDLYLKVYAVLETERTEPQFRSQAVIDEVKADKALLNSFLGNSHEPSIDQN